ncbi:uncharacterized protein LOC131230871 [Magnolia sinica]|uniref:uncharacterized protein LOC131230871 n=1 Tax=Magnolia sinica TaxID=86752 RepID=UPI0026591737|nr:uncharacterized protein LOC131230871 [Magnolia sinica]XP_058082880.1 uncharacterized protein LOC131230871 [Magnolia sinica]XP_058082881.1 uncharacterized protein LOC131230871 [Magnolia sinica]XP_058082882.1 uncharacterized protein LOC131230871 [Magnolia sinica]
MHVFLFSQPFFPSHYSYSPFSQTKPKNPRLLLPIVKTIIPPSKPLSFSNLDVNSSDFDSPSVEDGDGDKFEPSVSSSDQELVTVSGDGVDIEIEKIGNNSRRIRSRIGIDASLETVWNLLTDYERLSDFIPGLAVSQLLEKKENFAKLFQIGQQNLAFGLKFNAKGIVDCYEKDLQRLSFGQRRDIEFKMVEGDFQTFEGKWSIMQADTENCKEGEYSKGQEFQTILAYVVDVEPKLWLPVGLVEGRLCKEIELNLTSIREEVRRAVLGILPTY